MNAAPYWDILPLAQQRLWPQLRGLPEHFVLYGGTALALQLGHRDSVGFDFFSSRPFVPRQLYGKLEFLARGRITQQERNTLTVRTATEDGAVSVSFFGGLKLNSVDWPLTVAPGVRLAGVRDIFGCKCAAIQQRQILKDLSDICALLRHGLSLSEGLGCARAIYGEPFNPHVTLRVLSYPPALEGVSAADRHLIAQAVEWTKGENLPRIAPAGSIGLIPASPGSGVSVGTDPGPGE